MSKSSTSVSKKSGGRLPSSRTSAHASFQGDTANAVSMAQEMTAVAEQMYYEAETAIEQCLANQKKAHNMARVPLSRDFVGFLEPQTTSGTDTRAAHLGHVLRKNHRRATDTLE